MTTQDQDDGPTYDGRFRGVRHGSNSAATLAMAAKGSGSNRFSTATAAHKSIEAELVDGLRQTIVSCWRKESDGRVHSLSESKAIRGTECDAGSVQAPQGNLQQAGGYYETGCEILKQIADSFDNKCRPSTKVVFDYFLSGNCMHRKHVYSELSESEAKFFLDRGKRSPYHSHKFSGAFPARVKFHLRAKRKVVNCCSHSWGGASEPLAGHDGTRFRKAETGRPNQLTRASHD